MLLKVHCSSFSAVSTGTLNWPMVDIFQNKDELLDGTVPWPTKIRGRICHIWRPKLRGQFFKRTRQSEGTVLYYVIVGFVYSAIFLPKIKSLSGQCWRILIWKILKWDHLFLYLIDLKRAVWYCIYFEKLQVILSRQERRKENC